ncbi:nicotinate phosphoribosyltransferase [Halobacillus rhizosphaerae]|uniref:nicotinate phosphoribosyltransferase n=1 Tax=Halobacillus rhizosphaerae TaxID=3064889 RepID=UPI00398A849F
MTQYIYPATLLCDFYKVSHRKQYPANTQRIYSTWTPRSNKYFPVADKVVAFGIQSFVKKYLIKYFNENFFNRKLEEVVAEYKRVIQFTLGEANPDTSHIEELHKLGYLPVHVKAVKEGTLVPFKVPMLTVENTGDDRFYWLTNYLETIMSNELWQPMTSATISYQYRKLLNGYALKTVGDTTGVGFQGHDFSMRGMGSLETSMSSGAGHLLSFVGTDTIPAILYHEEFYNANIEKELVGTSIPATEHSVMCSYGKVNEFDLFAHLINNVYPNGLFSVVSDTWDFWKVVGEYLPKLKSDIMKRDGKVVIRPDSGDPVKIICGDPEAEEPIVRKGLIEVLWDIFGGTTTEQGYKLLDSHIGAIYGDSITLERAEEILNQLEHKGFASTNIVFGIGSFTFQYNTRDTLGFAMKATYAKVDGEERLIYKDPKTDDGTKKSLKGRVVVIENEKGELEAVDGLYKQDTVNVIQDKLETVFINGRLERDESLSEIRERLHGKSDLI